ncbi:MAG: hypothetical protein C4532_12855 [Candidatus Abyssobacteria bacterium SURF_17]|uniref:Desulfoferrodoxin N-terminal domain-containing protein n=1 Tax=Candidatus Abyssobacteria bacterium SURF_17 TaxID=2093361 RepID=A0A419EVS3_9BACT|nr:MAG: hypothetical protein C4532_12855 [Candidatus Abyssubacteria bacterium SURF_17]
MICGSEVVLIRAKTGAVRPVCCNQPMTLTKDSVRMYRCPVCGSEAGVIREKSGGLRLICCNVPMQALAA